MKEEQQPLKNPSDSPLKSYEPSHKALEINGNNNHSKQYGCQTIIKMFDQINLKEKLVDIIKFV